MIKWLFAGLMCCTVLAGPAEAAGKRLALVIGNSNYPTAPLANPRNDAADVGASLRAVGFEVTPAIDLSKQALDAALERFARASAGAEAVLIYYAGHAMQYEGANYLIPVDAILQDQYSIQYQLVNLENVRAALNGCKDCIKVLMLDSCRNNPLANRIMAARDFGAGSRGLAPMQRSEGLIVVYATQAGKIAEDGEGRNSPFASAFVTELAKPRQHIVDLFVKVQNDVLKATDLRQSPDLTISGLSESAQRFFFNDVNDGDDVAFSSLDFDNVGQLGAFAERYPTSAMRPIVDRRLAVLVQAAKERERDQAEERGRQDRASAEREQAEREKAERDRVANEQAKREQAAGERAVAEHAADEASKGRVERLDAQRALERKDQASREVARHRQAETDRVAAEDAQRRQHLVDQANHERATKDLAAKDQAERERADQQDAQRQRDRGDRLANERAASERVAKEKADRLEAMRQQERRDQEVRDAAKRQEASRLRLEREQAARDERRRLEREREADKRKPAWAPDGERYVSHRDVARRPPARDGMGAGYAERSPSPNPPYVSTQADIPRRVPVSTVPDVRGSF